MRWLRGVATVLVVTGASCIVGQYALRPWFRHWGATPDEIRATYPGDEPGRPPRGDDVVRAITIAAPRATVWAWLAQLGQDRGGFYSYDLLENLVGCQMPTSDRLRPGRQQWSVGDRLWMYPAHRAGGAGFATLRHYRPGDILVFGTRVVGTPLQAPENGRWGFTLTAIDSATTRLVAFGRGSGGRSLLGTLFDRGIFEPVHFIMERRMLLGIAGLAETGTRHRFQNHLMVLLWCFTLLPITVLTIRLIRDSASWARTTILLAAWHALLLWLALRQPALAIAIPVTGLLALPTRPRRSPHEGLFTGAS